MNILTRFDDKQVTKTYKLRWDIKFTKKTVDTSLHSLCILTRI